MKLSQFQPVKTTATQPEEYFFLEEEMKTKALELLNEQKEYLPPFDFKELADGIRYSLGYSQGDGVSFSKWKTETHEIIKTTSRYDHERTFFVESSDNDSYETDEKSTEILRTICKQLEAFWYAIIEQDDTYQNQLNTLALFERTHNIRKDLSDYLTTKDDTTATIIWYYDNTPIYVEDIDLTESTETITNTFYS